ncbi:hypothetical protein J6590_044226 [Homalodisca vitripennis]|nr:hypothetical protein J6590_044226 [Homalodisca vitripennis]
MPGCDDQNLQRKVGFGSQWPVSYSTGQEAGHPGKSCTSGSLPIELYALTQASLHGLGNRSGGYHHRGRELWLISAVPLGAEHESGHPE